MRGGKEARRGKRRRKEKRKEKRKMGRKRERWCRRLGGGCVFRCGLACAVWRLGRGTLIRRGTVGLNVSREGCGLSLGGEERIGGQKRKDLLLCREMAHVPQRPRRRWICWRADSLLCAGS